MTKLVVKPLLERVIPISGISSELYRARGTQFTGKIFKEVCNIWPIMEHFHVSYHPQCSEDEEVSELVELLS